LNQCADLKAAGTTIYFDDVTELTLGVDSMNGHDQPTDIQSPTYGDYHYHAFAGWDDGTYANYVVGYGMDGVPIMGMNSE